VRKLGLLLVACAAIASASTRASAQESASPASTRASAANGAAVFLRTGCPACHGTVGQGGVGPRLAPNTLPLTAFQTWVRNGTPGWSIATGMPAFSPAVLSDRDLADARAYLANLPAPRAPDDIALLRPWTPR
jgi:mono/diheme cytochrome c family protein